MLCEICGQNEATFHYSEVVNGKKTEHHLCNDCASKTDISYYSSLFENEGRLVQFLGGLLGGNIFGTTESDPRAQVICPNCKTSYGEFIKNSMFGCSECYSVFEPLLDDSIKKIQGSVKHLGKTPTSRTESNAKLDESIIEELPTENKELPKQEDLKSLTKKKEHLSALLSRAVEDEDYYEAAKLRDEIKELTAQIGRLSNE